MQRICRSRINARRVWLGLSVLAGALLFQLPALAQTAVTWGGATISDITAEVGIDIGNRVLPAASGGTPPYTYSVSTNLTNNELPAGLNFDAATRTLSGTPTEVTTSPANVTYDAQDSQSNTPSSALSFTITVNPASELRVVRKVSGDKRITVEWYGLSTATSYCVKHRKVVETTFSSCTTLNFSRTGLITHSITNLEVDTRYSVFIEAYNSLNSPIESISVEVATKGDETPKFASGAVVAAIDVRAGLPYESAVLPEATGGNGALTYTVVPELPEGLTFNATTRVISGRATTPQASKEYQYRATDVDGDFAALRFSITLKERLPITGVTVTADDQTLTLAWDAVLNAVDYKVQYRVRGDAAYTDDSTSSSRTRSIGGLVNDQAYDLRITAIDSDNQEFTSIETTGTPGDDSQIVVTATGGDGEVLVSWTAVAMAQRYRIRYQVKSTVSNFNEGSYELSVPAGGFKVSNLELSTTYTVRVDAYGANNLLLTSDTDDATTLANTQPSFGTTTIDPIVLYLGIAVDQVLPARASNGNQPFTYSITPTLPAGLAFDSKTRRLTGIPATGSGTSNYTYQVRDREGDSATLTFTIEFKPFFTQTGSGFTLPEVSPVFTDVNRVLARDRAIPTGNTTEPRTIVYRLDPESDKVLSVVTSTANHKGPIIGLDDTKSLDYETRRVHNVKITATSDNGNGQSITLGIYTLTLTVTDVNEAPIKNTKPKAGEPDVELSSIGNSQQNYVLANEFTDPEQLTVTINQSSLRVVGFDAMGAEVVHAEGTRASEIVGTDQVVKAEVINEVLLRVTVDTSAITTTRSITNEVRVRTQDPGNNQSEYYTIKLNVKIGANTSPNFVGGATTILATVKENSDLVWTFHAEDNDDKQRSNGVHNDILKFNLQGSRSESFWEHDVLMLEGSCLYVESARNNDLDQWEAQVKTFASTFADGSVRCQKGFDFERQVSPQFVLEVSDGFGGAASVVVTVMVTDVNEAPQQDLSSLQQVRLSQGATDTLNLNQLVVDPEGSTVSFIVNSLDTRVATVQNTAGLITITGIGNGRTTIVVTYLDTGGNKGSFNVNVVVKDAQSNQQPAFINGVDAVTLTVPENSPGGTKIAQPNIATDPDAEDELTYSINLHTDLFEVSSKSGSEGQLSVKPGAKLDFETRNSYDFTMTVSDGWGGEDSIQVNLSLLDVNEPPSLNPATTTEGRIDDVSVSVKEELEFNLTPYFVDPDQNDKNRLRYLASTSNRSIASVQTTATGILLINGLREGTVEVTVIASDMGGLEVILTFNVNVVADTPPSVVNEIPDQILTLNQIKDIPLTNVFSDMEGTVAVISAEESDETVVLAILSNDKTELSLFGFSVGTADVTITAEDKAGTQISDVFMVTVVAPTSTSGPRLANRIGDQTVTAGDDFLLDISDVFAMASEHEFKSIEVRSLDPAIVQGEVNPSTLELSLFGYEPGDALVSVIFTSSEGRQVADLFTTYVETRPELIAAVPDVQLEIGGSGWHLDLSTVFVDRDGDSLEYGMTVSNPTFVDAELIESTVGLQPVQAGQTQLVLSARDPKGRVAQFELSISVGNQALKAAATDSLANYGRSLMSGITDAIGMRVAKNTKTADLRPSQWVEQFIRQNVSTNHSGLDQSGMPYIEPVSTVDFGTPSQYDARSPKSFALGFGGEQPGWSIWSHVDLQHLAQESSELESRSHFFGMDFKASKRWMLGVAVARNRADSEFGYGTAQRSYAINSTLLIPYVKHEIGLDSEVWGLIGLGRGRIEIMGGSELETTPLATRMWSVGARQNLAQVKMFEFALRADYSRAHIQTDHGGTLAASLTSSVDRSRLGVEVQTTFETPMGSFNPFVDLGIRYDGGMNAFGSGMEAGSGFRWQHQNVALEVRGRSVSQQSLSEQKSLTLSLSLTPSVDGTGVSFSITPQWGALSPTSNAMVFNDHYLRSLGTSVATSDTPRSMSVEVGYGLNVLRDQFLVRPFMQYDEDSFSYQQALVGVTLGRTTHAKKALEVELALGVNTHKSTQNTGSVASVRASLKF